MKLIINESSSKSVLIHDKDYDLCYYDEDGLLGDIGEIISSADIKQYWNNNYAEDPVLAQHRTFGNWWMEVMMTYELPEVNPDYI